MFDECTRQVAEAYRRPFRLLCTPSLAASWLVPRLNRLSFSDRLRLRIAQGLPSTFFAFNDADIAFAESRQDDPMIREFSSCIHAEVAAEGFDPDTALEQQVPTLQ